MKITYRGRERFSSRLLISEPSLPAGLGIAEHIFSPLGVRTNSKMCIGSALSVKISAELLRVL